MKPSLKDHLRSERGVSLLELVVAGAMFAALVLALSPSMLNTRRAAAFSANAAAATTLALDKLEHIRVLEPTHADLTAGVHVDTANPLQANGTAGGIYARRWTVTNDTPEVGMKRVEMQVTWRDQMGSSAVNLVTLVMP